MGYTTDFVGSFKFSRVLTIEFKSKTKAKNAFKKFNLEEVELETAK